MKKIFIILVILITTILTGCVIEINRGFDIRIDEPNLKKGEFKTYEKEFELKDNKKLDINLELNASKTYITRTNDKLFKARVDTNIEGLEPVINISGNNLTVEDNYTIKNYKNVVNNFVNDWHMEITDRLPLNFDIKSNATNSTFDFSGMNIQDIDLDVNASDVDIRFNEKNSGNLETFELDLNVGKVNISGLDNSGAQKIDIDLNVGNLELAFGENIYRNTDILINGNVGAIEIDLPDNVGIKIEKKDNLINLDIEGRNYEEKSSNEYISENYENAQYKINILARGNAYKIKVR